MKRSKRYRESVKLYDQDREYSIEDAVGVLQKMPKAKFDETVEVSLNLGVDVRKNDQIVRGSAKLPHGTGKTLRVVVFCEPEKESEAKAAGADYVGSNDLIQKIEKGWMDFDYCIATPGMMRNVSRLGKALGPRGLMPSPKNGSVTDNVAYAVQEVKQGKLDFRMDKFGGLNAGIGKRSFTSQQIVDNINEFFAALIKAKPAASKGKFIKGAFLTSTMNPSLKLQLPKEIDV